MGQDEETIGHWIQRWRIRQGLTQELLASKAGCSKDLIHKIETGWRALTPNMAERLAKYLTNTDEEKELFLKVALRKYSVDWPTIESPFPTPTDTPTSPPTNITSPLPEGTISLLFTDIAGSTQLLRRTGDAYVGILAEHQHLLREAFHAHHGHEVHTEGDAFFVAFANATEALAAAIEAQQALASHLWPEHARVLVRMGLHTGRPLRIDHNYAGLDVHRAKRICDAGHGGQILLSQTTHDLVSHILPEGVSLRGLGTHHLKDLPYPEPLFQIVVQDLPTDFPPLRSLSTRELTPEVPDRKRQKMLQKVRDIWVKGVLEHSLHDIARIALGLEERPDLVAHPWELQMQQPDRPARTLPSGTAISTMFDAFGGELLILGAPGSGKTTMLLDLARDLLDRAEANASEPMPVVFNLSSWAAKRQALVVWLVDELNRRYGVSRRLAQRWVETEEVLTLLDGLDEVQAEYREACVEAINAFRYDHGMVPIVICSRIADYESLVGRLKLQAALLIQPLTLEQIDSYVADAGDRLAGLRAALLEDPALRELAETPLILSLMSLAYADVLSPDSTTEATVQERRNHLFAMYVRRMLALPNTYRVHGTADQSSVGDRMRHIEYAPPRTAHWLVFLARMLQQQNEQLFFIEQLQPDWLPAYLRRWYYLLIAVLVGFPVGLLVYMGTGDPNNGLLWGIGLGLGVILAGDLKLSDSGNWSWRRRLAWGIGIGISVAFYFVAGKNWEVGGFFGLLIVIAFFVGLLAKSIDSMRAAIAHQLRLRFGVQVGRGLRVGLLVGLSTGLATGLLWGPGDGLFVGISFGFSTGLIAGVIGEVQTVEILHWNYISGAIAGILAFIGTWLSTKLGLSSLNQADAVRVGILFGLLTGLGGQEDIETRTIPNHGMWKSIHNMVRGMGVGLVLGILVAIIQGVDNGRRAGIITALLWAWRGGLAACIQHITIRLFLYWRNDISGNYVRFLDYSAHHLLLRKVGGGYVFIHNFLLEYFAAGAAGVADNTPRSHSFTKQIAEDERKSV